MVLVKICGLSDVEAVKAADSADYAGFVVGSPKSHRNISLRKFEELRSYLNHARPVLVTVNHSMKFLHRLRQYKDVIIQLHGSAREFADFIEYTALGLNYEEFSLQNYSRSNPYSFLSVDSTKKNGYGGTGNTWTWDKVISDEFPTLVAGGIDLGNVERALDKTKASGVDVSSSMETAKKKDPHKISNFIEYVRGL